MKRKQTLGLLVIIYVSMYVLGKIVAWGVSYLCDASFPIGWFFGVVASLWYSSYVVNYVRDREGGKQ